MGQGHHGKYDIINVNNKCAYSIKINYMRKLINGLYHAFGYSVSTVKHNPIIKILITYNIFILDARLLLSFDIMRL